MMTKFVELGCNDEKAKVLILESLSVCAYNHTMSRKLLDRFSAATGPMFAITGDWFGLDQMTSYNVVILATEGEYASGDRPVEHLVSFVQNYMKTTKNAVVLSENWGADREDIGKPWWPSLRVACYGDHEVYHLVTPEITDPEMIEDTIGARHYWQTSVCSSCARIPEGDIPDEGFLDEIIQNTKHIFIPAFDGSGYLIWSPT